LCYRKVNFSVNQLREHEAVIRNRHYSRKKKRNRHINIGIRHVKKMVPFNCVENIVVKKLKTYTQQCCSFQGIAFLECHISSSAVFSRSVKF
jgi:hypothetical protein